MKSIEYQAEIDGRTFQPTLDSIRNIEDLLRSNTSIELSCGNMGILDIFKPKVKRMENQRNVEGLIEALKHKDIFIRSRSAEALGRMGDERAVDPLIRSLRDKDWHVRGAARALGKIGDVSVMETLVQTLRHDEWLSVREGAIEALGEMGEPAVERLIRALKEDGRDARLMAAWALGCIGDEDAVEPLLRAKKDEDSTIGEAAKDALRRIEQRKAENCQKTTAHDAL